MIKINTQARFIEKRTPEPRRRRFVQKKNRQKNKTEWLTYVLWA